MKTLNLLIASLFVLALALTSCQKDNDLLAETNAEFKSDDIDPGWTPDPLKSYPNPFNDVTTITYKLQKKAKVTLVVYSPGYMGITYLVSEFKQKGTYNVEFDATGLPAGIYVAQLRIDKSVFKEKMKKVDSFESNPHLTD